MSDHVDTGDEQDRAQAALPEPEETGATVESYETEDGVVFYDADNPLAWLKAARPLTLNEQL